MFQQALTFGGKKKVNQDSLFVRMLRAGDICDGMGGYAKGEVESADLIGAFTECMWEPRKWLSGEAVDIKAVERQWQGIIFSVNRKIKEYGDRQGAKVGTTVTAMLISNSSYLLLNADDTSAYEIKDGVRQ